MLRTATEVACLTPRMGRDVRLCSPSSLEGREAVGGHSLSAFTSPAAAHETASLPQARPPLIVQCLACAGNPLAVHGFVLRSAVQPVVRAASRGLSAWPLPDLKAERFLVGVRGHLV